MKIFMAKLDIKYGFWRLNCALGEEWNFAYILPQAEGEQVRLVVPNSLHMGCIESPLYFFAASETSRYMSQQYFETPLDTLPDHKLVKQYDQGEEFESLPDTGSDNIH